MHILVAHTQAHGKVSVNRVLGNLKSMLTSMALIGTSDTCALIPKSEAVLRVALRSC
jgi:hypothetical protein